MNMSFTILSMETCPLKVAMEYFLLMFLMVKANLELAETGEIPTPTETNIAISKEEWKMLFCYATEADAEKAEPIHVEGMSARFPNIASTVCRNGKTLVITAKKEE